MSQTVELPRTKGPGSGLDDKWRVIVRNDDHNTFDHVAHTLAAFIPGVTLDSGYAIADRIHNTGQAIVWSGHARAGGAVLGAAARRRPDHGAARAGVGHDGAAGRTPTERWPRRCSARRSARTSSARSPASPIATALDLPPSGRPLHLRRARRAEVDRVARGLIAPACGPATGSASGAPTAPSGCSSSTRRPGSASILVNINPAYRTHELEYALRQSGCRCSSPRATSRRPTTWRWSTRCGASLPGARADRDLSAPGLGRAAGGRGRRRRRRPARTRGRARLQRPDQHPVHVAAPPASPRARRSRTTTSSTTATSSARGCALHRARTASACRCRSTTASAW